MQAFEPITVAPAETVEASSADGVRSGSSAAAQITPASSSRRASRAAGKLSLMESGRSSPVPDELLTAYV